MTFHLATQPSKGLTCHFKYKQDTMYGMQYFTQVICSFYSKSSKQKMLAALVLLTQYGNVFQLLIVTET